MGFSDLFDADAKQSLDVVSVGPLQAERGVAHVANSLLRVPFDFMPSVLGDSLKDFADARVPALQN